MDEQMYTVYETLQNLGVKDKPVITVFNKIDRMEDTWVPRDLRADYHVKISAKTGVLSWNLANMSLLSTGVYTEDKEGKKKDLIFTGDGKALKTVLLRAVHTKENGKKIRFTMIGQGGSGFAITWENKEVTIDAELTAIKKVKGFLASFEEELTDEEAAAIVAA